MADIYGQLVKAQAENLAADISSPPTGVIYFNTSTNILKWYDSASWRVAVSRDATETLSNKTMGSTNTLTGATAASFTNTGTITLPTATCTLVGKDTTDVLTNKDFDGGTASNTLRFTLPKNTTANLAALTDKEGTMAYDTDLDKPVYNDGSNFIALATSSNATPTVAGIATSYFPSIQSAVSTGTSDVTVTTTDGLALIVCTDTSDQLVNLPAVADNTGRIITILNDTSTGSNINGGRDVTIDPSGGELIEGAATNVLKARGSKITLYCDSTRWIVLAVYDRMEASQTLTASGAANNVFANVVSYSVPPGTWQMSGQLGMQLGTATTMTQIACAISTFTGNTLTDHVTGYNQATSAVASTVSNGNGSATVPGLNVTLTTATTYYFKQLASFTGGGAPDYAGRFTCTRIT